MSTENPYEPSQLREPSRRPSAGHVVATVFLGVLALPAGGIAFFCTCLGTAIATDSLEVWHLVLSGTVAVLVIGLLIYAAVYVHRRGVKRQRESRFM